MVSAPSPAGVTFDRVCAALRRNGIRFVTDYRGQELVFRAVRMQHHLAVSLEGPNREVLTIRTNVLERIPRDFETRAYAAINEWNRTRRFLKAYLTSPTPDELAVAAEFNVPISGGLTDELLDELIDCGNACASDFVRWLYEEADLF